MNKHLLAALAAVVAVSSALSQQTAATVSELDSGVSAMELAALAKPQHQKGSVLGETVLSGWYAAPNGTPTGNGTVNNPWDFQTALNGGNSSNRVRPGDTVWLRGGLYNSSPDWRCNIAGTQDSPVIFRQYPNEIARVTSSAQTNTEGVLFVGRDCHYVWFWGFEVFVNSTVRQTLQRGSFPTDIVRMSGVNNITITSNKGNKYINLIVHDTSNGMGVWRLNDGVEVYGNLVYYSGWNAPDRAHGHGIYSQNMGDKTTTIMDNVVFKNHSHGLHLYGSGNFGQNYHIEGNVFFDNGALGREYSRNSLIQTEDNKNIVFKNNYTYFSPGKAGGTGMLMKAPCTNVSITGNYFVNAGYKAFELENGCGIAFTGNTVHSMDTRWGLLGMTPSSYPGNDFRIGSRPSGAQVFVRPNKYEVGRGHVIVYNWNNQATVDVNLSSVLKPGEAYKIVDVENYFGQPVLSGVYGGGAVTLPMHLTAVASPVGSVHSAPVHTPAEFGTFVVMKTDGTVSAPVNRAPQANAGPDVAVALPNVAQLDGAASDPDGDALTYSWTKVSGPGVVQFQNAGSLSARATFSAAGSYTLRLSVSDGRIVSVDDVVVTVTATTVNIPPTGYLDGVDPATGTVFGWAKDDNDTSRPVLVHIYIDRNAGTAGASPAAVVTADVHRSDIGSHAFNFAIPSQYRDGASHQVWAWAIDLNDQTGGSNRQLVGSPKSFRIGGAVPVPAPTPNPVGNMAPQVYIGEDRAVPFAPLHINPTVTDDGLPSGSSLAYNWYTISGPGQVTFSNPLGKNTVAAFPTSGTYRIRLRVTDGSQSAVDDMTLTVQAGPADTTVPTVSITSPANGTTVTGNAVTVSAQAADNSAVSGVSFYYGNTQIGVEDSTAPYAVTWNTTEVQNGSYSLRAVARDAAGNVSNSSIVTVTVNNQTAPSPEPVPNEPSPDKSYLFYEAESGKLAERMRTIYVGYSASGNVAVRSDTANSGSVTITVDVLVPGSYTVWGHGYIPHENRNSFYVSVNGAQEQLWEIPVSGEWKWSKLTGSGGGERAFTLGAGTHTITFRTAEANTWLDKILVTNDSAFVPSGK